MKRGFWPGQDVVGRRLRRNSAEMPGGWLTVVGIVGDVNHFFLDTQVRPTVYVSYLQRPVCGPNFVIRNEAPFEVAAPEIRQAVRSVDGKQQAYDLQNLKRFFTELSAAVGIMTSLMTAFAIALGLSAAGMYALMAYSAAQRRQEIGIRMALGAKPRDVLKLGCGMRGASRSGVEPGDHCGAVRHNRSGFSYVSRRFPPPWHWLRRTCLRHEQA